MGPLPVRFLGRAAALAPLFPKLLAITLLACGMPTAWADGAITDEAVEDAIRRGVRWIKEQRTPFRHWEPDQNTGAQDWAGNTALAILALLYAGENPREDFLADSISWLAGQPLDATYTIATRAHVLALVPGNKYQSQLKADLKWLLEAPWPRGSKDAGGYDYRATLRSAEGGRWDNSNTQFGVLGVWMASEAGLEVPPSYWEMIADHWLRHQRPDGGWGYQADQAPTGSMTAAGLASLFVVLDRRYADRPKEAPAILSAIEAGLDWFGRHYTPDNPHGDARWRYYYLYGVERVGRASGYKYFRDRDWFREGAAFLLDNQRDDGHWDGSGAGMDDLRNTAFALMFLCHGRAPLLFNKLQHGPDWNSRLRDVAALTQYVSRMFERPLNWQIVRLDGPLDDLLDAPVLYLRGEVAWEFEEEQVQKLRDYCLSGGMLFAVSAGEGFQQSIEKFARRAFPEHRLRRVPDDHPLFSGEVAFRIDAPPILLEVHNGLRTLMLICTRDLAPAWSRATGRGKSCPEIDLAANVYLYATDKTQFRSRLQTPVIRLNERKIEHSISIARIQYRGDWNVEPQGWIRLSRYMNNATGTRLLVSSGLTLDADELSEFRVAHMTGTGAFELTADELKGLRRFLVGGGTLLADAAGGSPEFTRSLEQWVRQALQDEPQTVPEDSFLYTGTGLDGAVDVTDVGYRRAALGLARGRKGPLLKVFGVRGRYAVIYSPLDLSGSLLGTPIYNLRGYDPDSTLKIMRNLILYGDLKRPDKARLHRGDAP